jgi:hypothetical protein
MTFQVLGYVVLIGDKFLGFGGGAVSEYPDARVFPTWSRADAAAEQLPDGLDGVQVVSCADYQAGDYEVQS